MAFWPGRLGSRTPQLPRGARRGPLGAKSTSENSVLTVYQEEFFPRKAGVLFVFKQHFFNQVVPDQNRVKASPQLRDRISWPSTLPV